MCLKVDEGLTEEVRQRGQIEGYKLVTYDGEGKLQSVFMFEFRYVPGENQALGPVRIEEGLLSSGVIHVYLNRIVAEGLAKSKNGTVVAVVCEAEDLVKAGTWSTGSLGEETAGYTKVWIRPKDYEEAVKYLEDIWQDEEEDEDWDDEEDEDDYYDDEEDDEDEVGDEEEDLV